jgi:hypothetical protein
MGEVSFLGETLHKDISQIVFRTTQGDVFVLPRDLVYVIEEVDGSRLYMPSALARKKRISTPKE